MTGRTIHVSPAARSAVVTDCDARRPEEACGVLLADDRGRIVAAVAAENVWPDSADRVRRFSIDPLTQLRIERAANAAGQTVAGFYHSHPTGPAVPSAFDLGQAWPIYVYVIAGYSDGVCVEFSAWALDEFGAFVEHAVAIEDEAK